MEALAQSERRLEVGDDLNCPNEVACAFPRCGRNESHDRGVPAAASKEPITLPHKGSAAELAAIRETMERAGFGDVSEQGWNIPYYSSGQSALKTLRENVRWEVFERWAPFIEQTTKDAEDTINSRSSQKSI